MFASLRYQRKIIIESFASLRYHCHYCPTFQCFLRSLWPEACAAPEGIYTTGAELQLNVSAALQRPVLLLDVSTPQGLELHLNVSAQQRLVLLLKVSTPMGPSCIWTCLHYRGLCCSWRSEAEAAEHIMREKEAKLLYQHLSFLNCHSAIHCKDTIPRIRNKYSQKSTVIEPPPSQFPHSCVCEWFIYSHDWSAYSPTGKYVDQSSQ